MAVGVLRDGSPVIASDGGDRTVRVWRPADGTPLAHPLDLSEPVWGVALQGNIIITAGSWDIAIRSMTDTKLLPAQRPRPTRHDHRIMAGYPVHPRGIRPRAHAGSSPRDARLGHVIRYIC